MNHKHEDFASNELVIDGCIVTLTQLWELANIIQQQEYIPYNIELPIKEMRDMRNFLVHSYHKIDISIIRDTIQQNIPSISQQIKELIEKIDKNHKHLQWSEGMGI